MNLDMSWQKEVSERAHSFEKEVWHEYGGYTQVPFKDGRPWDRDRGCQIIDVLTRDAEGNWEAIECKSKEGFYSFSFSSIAKQLAMQRDALPKYISQRVVFEDFDFSEEGKEWAIQEMRRALICNLGYLGRDVKIEFMKRKERDRGERVSRVKEFIRNGLGEDDDLLEFLEKYMMEHYYAYTRKGGNDD